VLRATPRASAVAFRLPPFRRKARRTCSLTTSRRGRMGAVEARCAISPGRSRSRIVRSGQRIAAPLQDVLELADVARPVVLEQGPPGVGIDPDASGAEAVEEVAREELDVLRALAERRDRQAEHANPPEEVMPETTLADLALEIAMGGRHDPDVRLARHVAPDPRELVSLDRPEQLRLHGGAHLPDLVEEQRAAIRRLDAALACAVRAGERAPLVTEKLALEKTLGDRGAG
jgi:hypothetical protein